jgi:LacI family transcriptional regulator
MESTRRRVALRLNIDWGYSRALLRAISAYGGQRNWEVFLRTADQLRHMPADERLDGVVYDSSVSQADARLILGTACGVSVDAHEQFSSCPRVAADDIAVGRMAAEHLLARGYRHYAFFGEEGVWFSDCRQRGFVETLAAAGYPCTVLPIPPVSGGVPAVEKAQLQSLPKPVGVMACLDLFALRLSGYSQELGIAIPDELALIGADDDDIWCAMALPPLSSVVIATEEIAIQAAHLLEAQWRGEPVPECTLIPPIHVAARRSTDSITTDDEDLATAVRLIHQKAIQGLCVANILQQVAISRRRLEVGIKELCGRTPLQELRRVQLDHAKSLLRTSHLPVPAVGRHSGFRSTRQFRKQFEASVGMTPTAFRRQFHQGE